MTPKFYKSIDFGASPKVEDLTVRCSEKAGAGLDAARAKVVDLLAARVKQQQAPHAPEQLRRSPTALSFRARRKRDMPTIDLEAMLKGVDLDSLPPIMAMAGGRPRPAPSKAADLEIAGVDPAAHETGSNLDRIWFERHPRRRAYARPMIPGEVPTVIFPFDVTYYVVVVQLEPGTRARSPFVLFYRDDDTVARWREADLLRWVPKELRRFMQ
jgi:hypothetical protein